ncbi:MAG: hypothetical protein WBP13_03300 [Methylophilaceae bacterium]
MPDTNSDSNIDQLCHALLAVETQLELLSRQYSTLYASYTGQAFLEQQLLAADKLDNLILAATHEAASTIGFMRQNISLLAQFIQFRTQFSQWSDQELAQMIDNPALTMAKKVQLKAKCAPNNSPIAEIKSTWNALFNQQDYAKIKSKLNIE